MKKAFLVALSYSVIFGCSVTYNVPAPAVRSKNWHSKKGH